ncbi:ATP12 family chaperone protein [Afipia sp. DC4300-2b1]|uniref:ATP12 family chaperone protein n=1 Tax=Afipia sp. DC4300-2b1 TaxID=2804672 RepID=UPI003CE7C5C0
MRELFDEVAGKSPLDPREASRKSSRTPLRKRFYTSAGVAEGPEGFTVTLDGKPIRTPGRNPLAAPTRELAEAMAAEWDAQADNIDPMSMPLTRLANSVIDGVVKDVQAVADDAAKYFETDLLFYRAGFPDALIARQAEHWDPVLRWAADDLGAHFILAEGVIHVTQPETAVAAARSALPADAWPVGAFHVATTLTGSALLALALKHGVLDAAQVWAAAHVDEDWNREKWGADEEVDARRASKFRDFEAAAKVLRTL